MSKKPHPAVSNQSPELKLPDASLLLNSPTTSAYPLSASDHSSLVAAAMAENAARKRELNAMPASYPRNKVPRGNLPQSKNVPETVDGRLLPPQLAGRYGIPLFCAVVFTVGFYHFLNVEHNLAGAIL